MGVEIKTWLLSLAIFLLLPSSNGLSNSSSTSRREGKVFSLFSIVTFKNMGCKSLSSTSPAVQNSFRMGTCFTSSECASKGGTASGNCAAGFGVCCVFIITSGTTNQNCSYLRNPEFPNVLATTSSTTYTINKCSNDICYLRLDFETFAILGPTTLDENDGGACKADFLNIKAPPGPTVPQICGFNTGQHVYVRLGDKPIDNANLEFSFAGTATIRVWEIKVTQIECTNPNRPPDGCLQYFSETSGRITTFNFFATLIPQHLANQDYSACIRRPPGYCCVQYQVCPEVTDGFSIDSKIAPPTVNNFCPNDYVGIPSSASICSTSGPLFSKFCTNMLDPSGTTVNNPICDCTAPFLVHFHTDGLADTDLIPARGVCLDYTLLPC